DREHRRERGPRVPDRRGGPHLPRSAPGGLRGGRTALHDRHGGGGPPPHPHRGAGHGGSGGRGHRGRPAGDDRGRESGEAGREREAGPAVSEPEDFNAARERAVLRMGADEEFKALSRRWFQRSCGHRYSYHFTWLGRPIIQYPQDILAMQELIWRVKPDLVIETGIAHGGSLVFHASLLELLGGDGRVLGIDVDIRPHNRVEIERHPMRRRIDMLEGSSISEPIVEEARRRANGRERVMVVLDSNHTHEHVLRELELYSPLVRKGSYVVVFDTVIEDMPDGSFPDRPWGRGNNPATAVREFLRTNERF